MSTMKMLAILLLAAAVVSPACTDHRLERDFFKKDPRTRLERMRQYSLEDQYRIFRYGNDVVEPPVLQLADPIAEKGAVAVAFLLNKLQSEQDNYIYVVTDTLQVFQTMARLTTYDVKSDAALMKTLTTRVAGMKDKDWQATCVRMLQRIKDAK